MIDRDAFLEAVRSGREPEGAGEALRVLWLLRCRGWDAAHDVAQEMPDPDGAWLHAHLHRVEGDLGNAGYWYRRAGRPVAQGDLGEEWTAMVEHFVAEA
mgnify:CR=1 FL=1